MSDYTPGQLRRIDMLVAVHVEGLRVDASEWHNLSDAVRDAGGNLATVPHYTTDGAHAWRVLEWLVEGEADIEICKSMDGSGGYRSLDTTDWYHQRWGEAKTLPLAICLHALAVAGADVEKEVTR